MSISAKNNVKPPQRNNQTSNTKETSKSNGNHEKANPKSKPKILVLSLEDGNKERGFNRFKNLLKLPLVKASTLGVWFEDAAELEANVVGEGKKVQVKDLEEWKGFVEKKRELGERLMAQYTGLQVDERAEK